MACTRNGVQLQAVKNILERKKKQKKNMKTMVNCIEEEVTKDQLQKIQN
jgi:hypothetical protein